MTSPPQEIIAIGGIGGSGTRLIADIVMKFGFYMGASLNKSLDNLWFTLLFQRPGWFARFPADDDIVAALRLFHRAMTTGLSGTISIRDADFIHSLVRDLEQAAHGTGADRKTAEKLIASMPSKQGAPVGWGWKEPNSHIFLPQIVSEFAGIKYIYVIRNGLDMAFSNNTNQIRNWGKYICGISIIDEFVSEKMMLEYWIFANKRAIEIGKKQLNDKFMIINYNNFCRSSLDELQKLAEFLNIKADKNIIKKILNTIKPITINRFEKNDLSIFTKKQIESVREFGFDVDISTKII